MIQRVVRMTFEETKTKEFLQLFESTKHKIRTFPGCQHLELWQDPDDAAIFMTFSIWESQDHLNAYRNSPLFEDVWAKTKSLFADKPIAFSGKLVNQ